MFDCPCSTTESEISCFVALGEEHDISSLKGKAAKYSKKIIQRQQRMEEVPNMMEGLQVQTHQA
jgi:hypothetical protein